MKPILRAVGLTKVYGSDGVSTPALRGVDLEVLPGEFTAIVGPSGSGKSTLLHILGCLDKPSSGETYLGERRTDQLDPVSSARLRLQEIGFVFQAYNLIPVLTRAGECSVCVGAARRAEKGPRRESDASPGGAGDRRSRPSKAQPALGRPAAAGRRRTGFGRRTPGDPGGRADGQFGLPIGPLPHRVDETAQRRAGHDVSLFHARSPAARARHPHRPPRRRSRRLR